MMIHAQCALRDLTSLVSFFFQQIFTRQRLAIFEMEPTSFSPATGVDT